MLPMKIKVIVLLKKTKTVLSDSDNNSYDIKVIPSTYKKKGVMGDFTWMVKQPEYNDVLFIFNDDIEHFNSRSCKAEKGSAAMRPYRCTNPPRAEGIPTGIRGGGKGYGYSTLTVEVKKDIDRSFDIIRTLLRTGKYKRVMYSGTKKDIGSGIFKIGKDVREYIIGQLYGLETDN